MRISQETANSKLNLIPSDLEIRIYCLACVNVNSISVGCTKRSESQGETKKSDIEYQEFSKVFPLMQHF